MKYNKDGLKFFINKCTINTDINKQYMILPEDIRRLIWNYLHKKPFIECFICNTILVRFEYDIREDINTENIVQFNGYSKCIAC